VELASPEAFTVRSVASRSSPKHPCKHALALMLLATGPHPFADRAMPADVMRNAARERPSYHFDHAAEAQGRLTHLIDMI